MNAMIRVTVTVGKVRLYFEINNFERNLPTVLVVPTKHHQFHSQFINFQLLQQSAFIYQLAGILVRLLFGL